MERKVGELDACGTVSSRARSTRACLWEAVKHYRAAMRQGTAATKNRKLVAGAGRKLWKQKGTGPGPRRLDPHAALARWRNGPRTGAAQLRVCLSAQEAAGCTALGVTVKLSDGPADGWSRTSRSPRRRTKVFRQALNKLEAGKTTLLVEDQPRA